MDPLAGSYYVEATTRRIELEALELIEKIDGMGGVIPAIEQGFIQASIQRSAYTYQQDIEKEKRIIVGVNKFAINEPPPKGLLRVSKEVEQNQIKKLQKVKAERDNARVATALEKLKNAAHTEANLMPFILEAVRAYGSVGEICNTLRSVFGEYKENVVL